MCARLAFERSLFSTTDRWDVSLSVEAWTGDVIVGSLDGHCVWSLGSSSFVL